MLGSFNCHVYSTAYNLIMYPSFFSGLCSKTTFFHCACRIHISYAIIKLTIFACPQKKDNTFKVSKGAKIRNRYNQVPHLTQDTNGKVTNSQKDTTIESREVSPFPAGDHKVRKGAKIRNRYNQVPHLTQDTNGKVTNSQKTPQTRAKRSALSQQVTTKHI